MEASSIYYGLTLREVRNLTYEVAFANNILIPESWTSAKTAGEDWLKAFRQCHNDKLSLRNSEATSLNRAQAFNKTNVNTFFDNLEKHKFRPECIWNIDETGCSTVQTPL
ncbi:hypothetical protein RRG08_009239 [Elysia crispata]|uniref:Uncharacterized protein n=1 Tax=Elysia crispata TaxID=231223 RepID=A0AAE1AZ08_9GAST|nr:hypothetical protein RRG08_009239 [Elysia crispata]